MRGIGVDIIEIHRIASGLSEHGDSFLNRLFTQEEILYCSKFKKDATAHFAGRFAAKEAIAKALGVGFGEYLKWKDIEILPGIHGDPVVTLSKQASEKLGYPSLKLTISHCQEYAVAFAISL